MYRGICVFPDAAEAGAAGRATRTPFQPPRSKCPTKQGDASVEGPVVWLPDAWRAREHEEHHQLDKAMHKKLDHLLSGLAVIIELLQSLKEGQKHMQAELQPVADAINVLATEEGEVAQAVKTIVDKVNNGQVVVKEDAQTLVDGLNNVITGLKSIVDSTEVSDGAADPLPGPADSQSDAPVPSTIPASEAEPVTPVPVGPDTSAAPTPVAETANTDQGTSLEAPEPGALPPTPAVTEPQQEESSPVAGTTDSSSSGASPAS